MLIRSTDAIRWCQSRHAPLSYLESAVTLWCVSVADQGIPDFWLTAMANHDMIGEYVTERDADVSSRGA